VTPRLTIHHHCHAPLGPMLPRITPPAIGEYVYQIAQQQVCGAYCPGPTTRLVARPSRLIVVQPVGEELASAAVVRHRSVLLVACSTRQHGDDPRVDVDDVGHDKTGGVSDISERGGADTGPREPLPHRIFSFPAQNFVT
jgi:hypothetical protein